MKEKKQLILTIVLFFALTSSLKSKAYYEVPDAGRPSSVYSLCCCTKENEDNEKVVYNCKHIEEAKCPDKSKEYSVPGLECPSNLMFTRYVKEETKEEIN